MRILHVGYPKTGTTSLQQGLFHEMWRKGLVKTFISLDANRDSNFMFELHSALVPNSVPANRVSDGLRNQLENERFNSFLISDEMLLNRGDPQELAARAVDFFGADTTVLITFRDPWEFFVSMYQQAVKFGWLDDFESLQKQVTPLLLEVRRTIDAFASRFQTVIAVNKDHLSDRLWLQEFVGGNSEVLDSLMLSPLPRKNKSLSQKKVNQIARFNRLMLPLLKSLGYQPELNIVPWKRLRTSEKVRNFLGRALQHLKKGFATRTDRGLGIDAAAMARQFPQIREKYPSLDGVRGIEIWKNGELAKYLD